MPVLNHDFGSRKLYVQLFETYTFVIDSEPMSKIVEYEPCLADYHVVFHEIFTLNDQSLNTSEIKPLHLSVPRNRQGVKPAPSPTQVKTTTNAQEDQSTKRNQRFLSNRYLTQKPSAMTATNPPPAAPKPTDIIAETAQKIVEPQKQPEPPKPQQRLGISEGDNRVNTETLLRTEEFWVLPLSPSVTVRFIFTMDGNSGPGYVFRMMTESTHEVILSAEMKGASRNSGMSLYFEKHPVGSAKYIQGSMCFFAGVQTSRGLCEAGAALYNGAYTSSKDPKIFEFLVPALKKMDGKSRMFPILYADVSGLWTRASQLSKEAIRMKTRIPPKSASGDWDMTFGGRMTAPSLSNFEIYHESNERKTLCSLSLRRLNEYSLVISYPMSPLQGFLAAVAAVIPN